MKKKEFQEWAKELLKQGLSLEFPVRGISMYPVLKEGDMVRVKKIDASEIKIGDLIFAIFPPEEFIVHRVIRKRLNNQELIFITKGDAILSSSEKIHFKDVLGKVISIKRSGKEILFDNHLNRLKNKFYICILAFKKYPLYLIKKINDYLLKKIIFKIQSQKSYCDLVNNLFSKKKIVCRLATSEDSLSLARLFRGVWSTSLKSLEGYYYSQLEKSKGQRYFVVAQMENKIIGCSIAGKVGEINSSNFYWLVEKFYVNWRYRRLGAGTQILNYFLDKCLSGENGRRQLVKIKIDQSNISHFATFMLGYLKKSNFSCSNKLSSFLNRITNRKKKFRGEVKISLDFKRSFIDLHPFSEKIKWSKKKISFL